MTMTAIAQPQPGGHRSTLREQITTAARREPLRVFSLVAPELVWKAAGRNEARALCPWHADRDPSLFLATGGERAGQWLCRASAGCGGGDLFAFAMKRWGCAFPEAVERLGELLGYAARPTSAGRTPAGMGVCRYEIRDRSGALVATHLRQDRPDGTKRIWWERDGKPGLGGLSSAQLPLYGAHLLRAAPPEAPVVLCEGEKAAEALQARGLLALGTVTGANVTPGAQALCALIGREILLWPDADACGEAHMEAIARWLDSVGACARIVRWPDAPPGGDAADFDGSDEALAALLEGAHVWKPSGDDAAGAPEQPAVVIETIGEFLARKITQPEWVVPGLLAPGLCIIAARPKTGKTVLACNLAVAIAHPEGRFLDREVRASGPPLLLLLESAPGYGVQSDLRTMGWEGQGYIALTWPPVRDGGMEALQRTVAELRPPLVVVDTLDAFAPGTDWSDHRQAAAVMRPLWTLAMESGASVVVNHHTTKAVREDDPAATVLGSTALVSIPDTVWVIQPKGRGEFALTVQGRMIPTTELALKQHRPTLAWQMAANELGIRADSGEDAVWRALDSFEEPASVLEVAQRMGKSRRYVADVLASLWDKRAVEKISPGGSRSATFWRTV